jgi:hypothetical protein
VWRLAPGDGVGVVVDDLGAATAFFLELGRELASKMAVEDRGVNHVVGLDNVRVDLAMVRIPDGDSRLELTTSQRPPSTTVEPTRLRARGFRRIMFADVVARLRAERAELGGDVSSTRTSTGSATSAVPTASPSRWQQTS